MGDENRRWRLGNLALDGHDWGLDGRGDRGLLRGRLGEEAKAGGGGGEEGEVGDEAALVRAEGGVRVEHVGGVDEEGDGEVLGGLDEGEAHVVEGAGGGELLEVDEVRGELVDEGAEDHAVGEGGRGEVADGGEAGVAGGLVAHPLQERVLHELS